MNAKEIYTALIVAHEMGLIEINHKGMLEQLIGRGELLAIHSDNDGVPIWWAIAGLVADRLDNPADALARQYPDYQLHLCKWVECYKSNSGNTTWKVFDQDGEIIYLRQAHREMLEAAGWWIQLNKMGIGDTWETRMFLHTIDDCDFRKPMMVDQCCDTYTPADDPQEIK